MFSCLTRQWNWFPTDWKFWDHLSLHRQCDQRRFSPSIVIRSCKRRQSSDLFSLTWRSTMTIPTKLSESNSTQYSYYIGIYIVYSEHLLTYILCEFILCINQVACLIGLRHIASTFPGQPKPWTWTSGSWMTLTTSWPKWWQRVRGMTTMLRVWVANWFPNYCFSANKSIVSINEKTCLKSML